MKTLTKQTKSLKEKEIKREWHLIDASGKILGRLASEIAFFLQGKNKVNYTYNIDGGDYVVVINAKKIILSGKKAKNKTYTRYSGYPGGLKILKYADLFNKNIDFIIKHAVSGMLPKNKFRNKRLKRLFIFEDEKHSFSDKFLNNK